ncbi:MAG: MJ0042-type zinc finger domain-containing protein [Fuerstiella sp.]
MIIQCQDCSKKFQVPDSVAGKRVKCPICGNTINAVSIGGHDKPPHDESARVQKVLSKPQHPAVIDSGKSAQVFGAAELPSQQRKRQRKTAPERASHQRVATLKHKKAEPSHPTGRRRRTRPRRQKPDNAPPSDDWDESLSEDYSDPFGDSGSQSASRRSKKAKANRGGAIVGLGLRLIGWTMAILYILILLFFITFAIKSPGLITVSIIALGLGGLAATFTFLAGHIMCIIGANDIGTKGLALAALACAIGQFIMSLSNPDIHRQPVVFDLTGLLRIILPLAYTALFLSFMKQMAKSVRHKTTVRRANIILAGWCITTALVPVIVLTRGQVPPTLTLIMILVIPFCLIALGIMQIIAILSLGTELRKRGLQRPSSVKRSRRKAS